MSQTVEKRRHPRVAKRIRVRSRYEGAVELETVDLSIGGLSCTAPMPLPVMTKLALSLTLPNHGSAGKTTRDLVIESEAIVVRSEPSRSQRSNGGYRVALFFSRMEESHRRTLVDYLRQHRP